ncbi:Satratoxin biosynthesis SC1 cluster protein 4 [Apiospora aurea]|uniref:Satratoxin biosynthesis SC1 cluster protein 4 n=1 Tax=Apiospora aurea TaxID=335848 RepID=A0ABR1QK65_9PEZI
MDKREPVTASNLGPVVSLLAWIMEAMVVISIGVRLVLSSVSSERRNMENVTLLLATTFSIAFTVAVSVAVPNGIGRNQDEMTLQQLESLQKAVYSAGIMLVLISVCAQASVLVFLHDITRDRFHKRLIYAIASFITLFFTSSFFVAAFPCRRPHVWQVLGAQCIDQISFLEAFSTASIVVESALIALPVYMVYHLRLKRSEKATAISCFAARLVYVLVTFTS